MEVESLAKSSCESVIFDDLIQHHCRKWMPLYLKDVVWNGEASRMNQVLNAADISGRRWMRVLVVTKISQNGAVRFCLVNSPLCRCALVRALVVF